MFMFLFMHFHASAISIGLFHQSIYLIRLFSKLQISLHPLRAYPVYVNEYASGTQQQYYTTNESYSATGNHQGETYIVPVEEALLASQSRESPQAISAVSSSITNTFNSLVSSIYELKNGGTNEKYE